MLTEDMGVAWKTYNSYRENIGIQLVSTFPGSAALLVLFRRGAFESIVTNTVFLVIKEMGVSRVTIDVR